MSEFGAGLYAMTLTSALGGIVLLLLGEKKKLCASLRTVISLLLLLMLLSPIITAFERADRWLDGLSLMGTTGETGVELSALYDEKSVAYATAASEQALRRLLSAKTGIGIDDMLVTLQTDARDVENVEVTLVKVELLKEKDGIVKDKIRLYVEENFGCPCEIAVKGTLDAYFARDGDVLS